MIGLPGISGTLLPGRYLAEGLADDISARLTGEPLDARRRRLVGWWTGTARVCGPASGLRALFDLVAMPLFGMLGFRARNAVFDAHHATVQLVTPAGNAVGCVLLPWAERPSSLWKELVTVARDIGASWCFLAAPPFVSLVDARGQTFRRGLEFTLPDVFDGRSFPRFWLLARAAAFDPNADHPGQPTCRLDDLVARALLFQDAVRADLQAGVHEALTALSRVLNHRAAAERFDEALTLVYRILFLLFAESRDLMPLALPLYRQAYAIGSLSGQAVRSAPVPGLWEGLAAITRLSRVGCRTDDLVVQAFNGHLFARASSPSLESARCGRRRTGADVARDVAMQRALTTLATRPSRAGRETISYRDLGVEQLGAVYERILDLDPIAVTSQPGPRPQSRAAQPSRQHSSRRKESGTFYTPRALAEFVVRRTLAPLVEGASADAILSLRVVDPAMGSGAFLVAACRYLAAAYERALIDDGRASPADFNEDERANARRLIAERCLAGVDRNPVAVQLARLSLWLTTVARGRPLGFLDHMLRVGNSLLGTTPDDLWRTGERTRTTTTTLPLLDDRLLGDAVRAANRPLASLRAMRDDSVDSVRAKETLWRQLTSSRSPLRAWRHAANLWCARWFWPATAGKPPSPAELRALLDAILNGDPTIGAARVDAALAVSDAVNAEQSFFHWPLEFSDMFYDTDGVPKPDGGFDAVLANPPWEMLRRGPSADDGSGDDHAVRFTEAATSSRHAHVRFIRDSGVYSSCDRGHVNLYQPFLERALTLTRPGGRVGMILPWGFAVDDGAASLRKRLFTNTGAQTLVGLDNAKGLFPIHRGLRFLVTVATRGGPASDIRARFGVTSADELDALPDRDPPGASVYPIRMTAATIEAIGGPSLRVPDVRRAGDLEFLTRLAARFRPLHSADGWQARFGRDLNATEDRPFFGRTGLPVLEGKHLEPFRVSAALEGVHRIAPAVARRLLPDARFERPRLAYRDVSGTANRVSLIAAVLPAGTLTTHTIFCLRTILEPGALHFLCGLFNSYVLNAYVRMLMGNHLTTTLIECLPVPPWAGSAQVRRISRLARWLAEGRRPDAEARLQARVAHLYGLSAAEFSRVLEGFPLVPLADRERAARAFRREPG